MRFITCCSVLCAWSVTYAEFVWIRAVSCNDGTHWTRLTSLWSYALCSVEFVWGLWSRTEGRSVLALFLLALANHELWQSCEFDFSIYADNTWCQSDPDSIAFHLSAVSWSPSRMRLSAMHPRLSPAYLWSFCYSTFPHGAIWPDLKIESGLHLSWFSLTWGFAKSELHQRNLCPAIDLSKLFLKDNYEATEDGFQTIASVSTHLSFFDTL